MTSKLKLLVRSLHKLAFGEFGLNTSVSSYLLKMAINKHLASNYSV